MSTPSVNARILVEMFPDVGESSEFTLDTAVVLPLVLASSSTTWKGASITKKVIAASDTDVTFTVSSAKMVVILADDDILFKSESGGTSNRGTAFMFAGKGTNAIRSGSWSFLISGNGSTPANITVFTLAP
jgi:hypothetical protein